MDNAPGAAVAVMTAWAGDDRNFVLALETASNYGAEEVVPSFITLCSLLLLRAGEQGISVADTLREIGLGGATRSDLP
jgi:hypothetical protein